MKVVNSYKYLGVWFTTRLSFSLAMKEQTAKAKKGIVEILKTLWKLGEITPSVFLTMFDTQIKPILLYGSEIWGTFEISHFEKAHTFALKKLFNVSPRTPNDKIGRAHV